MLVAQMPNREHYAQMKGDGDLFDTIRGILFYGFMEFISLIVLEIVMVQTIGISAIVQVAFLLQKQTDGVQTKFLFWVFYFSQASLDHYGEILFNFTTTAFTHPCVTRVGRVRLQLQVPLALGKLSRYYTKAGSIRMLHNSTPLSFYLASLDRLRLIARLSRPCLSATIPFARSAPSLSLDAGYDPAKHTDVSSPIHLMKTPRHGRTNQSPRRGQHPASQWSP